MSDRLDLRALSRDFTTTFTRQIAAALLGLATTVLIARYYGPEGNGTLAVALLLPSLLSSLLSLGVGSSNVYYIGSQQVNIRHLVRANIQIFIPLCTAGLTIGVGVIAWKSDVFFPGVNSNVLFCALAAYPFMLLNGYLHSIFQGMQKFRLYNALAISQPGIVLLIIGGLVLVDSQQLIFLVAAQLLSQGFVLSITVYWISKLVKDESSYYAESRFLIKILSYGWKAHAANILSLINYKADIFISNFFLGPAAVGVYVISVALAEVLWLVSRAVSTVLLPRLAQLAQDEAIRKELTPLIARWVLLITFAGAISVALLSKTLIETFFGSGYSDAAQPLLLLLPGIVLSGSSRVLANDIAARGRPEINMYMAVTVVVVNVIGNFYLIPIYGLSGAAMATTIAYTVNAILLLIIYGYISGNSWYAPILISAKDVSLLRSSFSRIN